MHQNKMRAFILIFFIAFLAPYLVFSQKLGEKDPDLAMREYMLRISRQLGVTCNFCHNVKNFKDESSEKWKIAKEHMKVVQLLNTQGFMRPGAPKADCYMCHRGMAVPDYKEKISLGVD